MGVKEELQQVNDIEEGRQSLLCHDKATDPKQSASPKYIHMSNTKWN